MVMEEALACELDRESIDDDRISHVRARTRSEPLIGAHIGMLLESRFEIHHALRVHRGALLYGGKCRITEAAVLVRVYVSDGFYDDDDVERFLTRANVVLRTSSAYVVLPRATGKLDNGDVYVVSFEVERHALPARILGQGLPPTGEVIEIARAVARGLQAAHSAGVVHGDVRVEHVFVSAGISPYRLGGFATPHWTADALLDSSTIRRRSGVTSPVDEAADVLGLGLTVYQLLSGRFPTPKDANGDALCAPYCVRGVTFPLAFPSHTPKGLASLVTRCVHPDPRCRPESMAVVLAALDDVARAGRREKRDAIASRTKRRASALAALIALVLLGAFIGMLLAMRLS